MATPQVQTSVSECVLRNQSHFLKVLVSSCGSDRRGDDSDSEENSPVIDITDLWVHKPQYLEKTRRNDERNTSSEDSGNNWDKVREIVAFSGKGKNAGENKLENSPSRSDASAAQVPNSGGVSSLVRRWRDFEVVANNNNNNSSISISRSNSTSSTLCDDSSIDGRLVQSSSGDGESDRTMPPLRDKDSDASERERLKVSDIIKKLTCNVIGGEENHSDHGGIESPSPRLRTPSDHHSPAVKSPRFIRGRHAFADLLMQMERDRVREIEGLMERKTVSKFQHKGRIQAMFRLKLIRGPVDANDSRPLHFKASESNKSKQSSIMNLRDKFNAGLQQGVADSKTTSKEETIGSISPNRDVVYRTLVIGNVSTSCQVKEEKHPQQGVETSLSPQKRSAEPSTRHSGSSSIAGIQLDGCSNSKEINSAVYEVTGQNVSSGVGHNESIKSLEIARPLETGDTEERKENGQQVAGTSEWGWVNEYSHMRNGSDESQYDFREQEDASQDWIIDVSRPQSVWEDLRQARYQEMLDPFLDNHDIQELLERRSVSNFLYGGMREIIDRLMISRSQGHQRTIDTAVQEVKEQTAADGGDRVEEQRCIASGEGEHQEGEDEEEVDNREEDNGDNDEYGCQIQQLNGPAGSVDQTWSYNQGRDLSDESDQTTSAYSQNNEPFRSPSQRHPSIEIQLIYELKTHMEQLHQEMFEIRRSLKSCVNMQMKLQRSIKHEVTAMLAQSGHKRGKGSGNKRLRKGYCCICQDTKVDSLLYRCGHICTCFNCARQLQSGDGKCPICQAPILDVVRTHTH